MPKNNNEEKNKSLLDKGFNLIVKAFNKQKNEYTNKIYELEDKINKLKEENSTYKNKLTILHKKLSKISKTVCDLDIEKEDENQNILINQELNTLNNNTNYQKDPKLNNFMNQKSILIKKNNLLQNKNNNFSSFIGETKLSQIPKKEEDTIEHKYKKKWNTKSFQ